ncbi:hypothetical protein CAI21_04685 [Alkalilimnicola ehrlichii]|uniref:NAD-dependent epimerase/dehydratase domain-containing protein n=1 Tax=Alkalilimnicola ehrlichii TaxID=351052 RepID=A0A3E0X269_9GAMM|nr:SDR family oxidoreductase [Alkalilimnicola ehrlichii]RFA30805.1 hypothetical protein CAI21_04685 [Alkalilimnicola ehrlichii]RFA38381.1 hypothetical protein CAL65_06050 [Alkalilimnicola ehrlichii]
MRILVTGATGFIGFHLAQRLAAAGHDIVAATRQDALWRARLPEWEWRHCDFMRDTNEQDWAERVADVDLVINAVGIINESRQQRFAEVQTEAPQALFAACSRAGVRVIQISALGAERPGASSPFLQSKQLADDYLWGLPGDCAIVYPAIVIGQGGNSTALFCRMAALPLVPLPGDGSQRINPIHIDDLTAAIVHLVEHWPKGKQRYLLTGASAYSIRELYALLREWMDLGKARFVAIPMPLLRFAAQVTERLKPDTLLRSDTLEMLHAANTPASTYAAAPPRPLAQALSARPAQRAEAWYAVFSALKPALIVSIAFVWIFTGLVSVLWNVPAGYMLLANAGVHGLLAGVLIYSGGAVDLVLGFMMLHRRWRRLAYGLQIGLMLTYMAIVSVILPAAWLDPLGSVTKNFPLLALTALLLLLETGGRTEAGPRPLAKR